MSDKIGGNADDQLIASLRETIAEQRSQLEEIGAQAAIAGASIDIFLKAIVEGKATPEEIIARISAAIIGAQRGDASEIATKFLAAIRQRLGDLQGPKD
jgi:hypothetical protein